jgi:hypothetical protein
MATCPNCRGRMGQTDVICPNCGHDFRESSPPVSSSAASPASSGRIASRHASREGFAYSNVARLALIVGQVMSGLGCIVAVIGCVLSLVSGQWLAALVSGPISVLFLLGMMVVFARVQDLE